MAGTEKSPLPSALAPEPRHIGAEHCLGQHTADTVKGQFPAVEMSELQLVVLAIVQMRLN